MFATLDELKDRLDWTLDADEERIATAALEDAAELALHYGKSDWTTTTAPRMVRTLVLRACKRYMQNPEGVTQSRAGDETMAWADDAGENAGTVYFTRDEQDILANLAGAKRRLHSAPITAHNTTARYDEPSYVPAGPGKSFPMFSDPVSPW